MGRGYLENWQEHTHTSSIPSQITKLKGNHSKGSRGPEGEKCVRRGNGGLGIYRGEKLEAFTNYSK